MTTRRHFLQLVTSALAGVGVSRIRQRLHASEGTVDSSSQPTDRKVLVPAHPWVYAATQPGYDITPVLDKIFADMKYAGLDGIELMHNVLRTESTVQRIDELSQQYELPVIGTSFGGAMWDRQQHNEILEDADCVVTNLARLGGRTLGTSVGAAPKSKTAQQLDDQADLLRKIIKMAKEKRVVLNLHNHTYEVAGKMHDLRGTLERIPDVKLGPDLNWLLRGGVDPVWFLNEYRDQIVFLHLRDQYADGKWSEGLGEGDMDYQAIAVALKRIKFTGDATIELAHERDFKPTRPLRETLKISRQFVRRTLGY